MSKVHWSLPQPGPAVEVLGQRAHEHLPVDGAGSARDLAPGDQHGAGRLGGRSGELPVVVVADGDVGGGGVAVLQLVGQVLEVGIVRPRFQKQDGSVRIFRKPRRHDAPSRPRPDDDNVVFHAAPPYALVCKSDWIISGLPRLVIPLPLGGVGPVIQCRRPRSSRRYWDTGVWHEIRIRAA